MSSAWQALQRGECALERRRALERAHERFVELLGPGADVGSGAEIALRESFGGAAGMRPVVLESWLRSQRGTIDPDRVLDRPALEDDELTELRRTHPLARVLPVVQRLLFDEARESRLIVAVGDARGRLLWLDGDTALRTRAEEMGFRAGMDWSERAVGTSAPGSALALDHALQVLGAEHFNRAVHDWSCTAAPVHDPFTGEIIGVVDVTGGDSAASPHMLPLLQATLAALEAELQLSALRDLMNRQPAPAAPAAAAYAVPSVTVVPADALADAPAASEWGDPEPREPSQHRPGTAPARLRLLGADAARLEWEGGGAVLTRRHAEILLALAAAPRGIGAAALADEVYGRPEAEQTLRAEMVRLRRWLEAALAPLGLGSRPYRLTGELGVDALDTLDLLAEGNCAAALAAYAGPVLPGSSAPAAERLREELDGTLRETMLESADADALYAYATHWAAGDDHVWETLLRVLPPDSPRRARVVARLAGARP